MISRADGDRGLVRERAEHFLQLQRHVQRAGGAHQRAVLSRAGGAAALGVEAGEAARRRVGEHLRVGDLAG